ncbi:MAG: zinc ribbon domain-containing protein [Pseudomonadales bacterium]
MPFTYIEWDEILKYCSECGSKIATRKLANENVERFVCGNCDRIFYENPKIIAGCLVEWEGKSYSPSAQ